MQQVYDEIQSLGAEVFFIGPETREDALKLMEKQSATIPLLYDVDGSVIRSFGLAFDIPDYLQPAMRAVGLPDANPDTGWMLPIPATYVVDTGGNIRARYMNTNYTYRMEPAAILDVLRDIRDAPNQTQT